MLKTVSCFTILRVLISNVTINIQIEARIYSSKVFLVTNLRNITVCTKRYIFSNSSVLISNMTSLISNISKTGVQKCPQKTFLVPNLAFYVFNECLHFSKLEGANFNYYDRLFKFPSINTQIRHFYPKSFSFKDYISSSKLLSKNIQVGPFWSKI